MYIHISTKGTRSYIILPLPWGFMRICEIFRSIQGEGINIGLPTIFIRTQGCNLRCRWCDTDYAQDSDIEEIGLEDIITHLEELPYGRICLTGGEPLLQEDIYDLIDRLMPRDISVETNGSIDISELVKREVMISMDYKTPSSGMDDRMCHDNINKLREDDQLKFVLKNKEDHKFAVDILRSNMIKAEVIFQPAWGTDHKVIVGMVLDEGIDVRVLPQLHKYIWGEKRGV